ncbi:MAG: hypothetical protein PHF62_03805 [Acholeplasmataceae bacterium]|nr:hypothetical protein [Acholeplasmataceae bacterium]MDD4204230.1 hypothetical protein [Acholeplasmataceae bacterium]MDD4468680.1 hypothetical protein [Acholeplasmataceae bacterium]MDD4823957.1 hypothetical protein [Acholeplasmataceae bacterium]
MKKFSDILNKIVSLLMNPLKIIGTASVPDKFIDFMRKNDWIKILLSFAIMLAIIIGFYVFDMKFSFDLPSN